MSPEDRLRAIELLDGVNTSEMFGWDGRKLLLEVYEDGANAAYVADQDNFYRRYAGLIEVARWAARQAIEQAKDEFR